MNKKLEKIWAKLQEPPIIELAKGTNIYDWGGKNIYPQDFLQVVDRSGVADAALKSLASYIQGEGLINVGEDSIWVDSFIKKMTPLLPKMAADRANWEAIAVHCQFNMAGDIIEATPMRSANLRRSKRDKAGESEYYFHCENWVKAKKPQFDANGQPVQSDLVPIEEQIFKYPAFTGSRDKTLALIAAYREMGVDYPGEILWLFSEGRLQSIYPEHTLTSADNAVYMDGEIDAFSVDQIDNNFVPSGVLSVVGNLDGTVPGTEKRDQQGNIIQPGKTAKAALNEQLKEKNERGRKGGVVVLTAKDGQNMPQFAPFNAQSRDTMYQATHERAMQKIMRTLRVPQLIFGDMSSGGLGSTKQIVDAIGLLNDRCLPDQKAIVEVVTMLASRWMDAPTMPIELAISQKFPISYIPDWFQQERLTNDEVRDLYGYEPLAPEQALPEQTQQTAFAKFLAWMKGGNQ
jgi:hypothetical protein